MKYRLVALDLDGTLLDENKIVPFETIQLLQKLARQGVTIVLASGRPEAGVKKIIEELGIESEIPVILFNGAEVKMRGITKDYSLSEQECNEVIKAARKRKSELAIWQKDKLFLENKRYFHKNIYR